MKSALQQISLTRSSPKSAALPRTKQEYESKNEACEDVPGAEPANAPIESMVAPSANLNSPDSPDKLDDMFYN